MDPQETYLKPAHSTMRHAQPKHNAGSEARHTRKSAQTLGSSGTPRRHTPLRSEEAPHRNPTQPLTAPVPAQAVPQRVSHVQPPHLASTAVTGAVSPLTAGAPIPHLTRNVPREGQPQAVPANHREAIHHQATSAELQARNRERG
jgi:hypothetical protein